MMVLPKDNLAYPVLIQAGPSSGSGFYFKRNQKLFLVTAKHVIYTNAGELYQTTLELTSYSVEIKHRTPFKLHVDLTRVKVRKMDTKDIAVIEIASTESIDGEDGFNISFLEGIDQKSSGSGKMIAVPVEGIKKFDEILVSNDVFVLGYPTSLGGDPGTSQIESNRPLLRKGVIAGINSLNETIILDCPVYFGNSGGLAIEVEQFEDGSRIFSTIGVVSQFVPFIETLQSLQLGYTNSSVENSGYSVVVPMDTIYELTTEKPEKISTTK